MYDNVGEKLKDWAKAIAVIGIILSITVAILLFVFSSQLARSYYGSSKIVSIVLGVITLILGPVASWVTSLIVYGIGQAVCNTDSSYYERTSNTASNSGLACDFCRMKNVALTRVIVKDELGTRYRNACPNCKGKYIEDRSSSKS